MLSQFTVKNIFAYCLLYRPLKVMFSSLWKFFKAEVLQDLNRDRIYPFSSGLVKKPRINQSLLVLHYVLPFSPLSAGVPHPFQPLQINKIKDGSEWMNCQRKYFCVPHSSARMFWIFFVGWWWRVKLCTVNHGCFDCWRWKNWSVMHWNVSETVKGKWHQN